MNPETPKAMLSRVEQMASGSPTWDLSPRDQLALQHVLSLLPRWIDVRERLPERTSMYLVETHAGTFDVDCFLASRKDWDTYRPSEIKRWMAIPQPPKGTE